MSDHPNNSDHHGPTRAEADDLDRMYDDDEYIYARDVLEGEELAAQLRTGVERVRRVR